MASFKELLKEVENAPKIGFKNGAWFPHKSPEGGTKTIAYGHKLTDEENKGNYVILPDGSVVDFDNRGLTPQEADQLLDADIQKHSKIAEVQWNTAQKTDFSSLSPLHQALLTEITFNTGTLKDDKGKFGWPSLAKGILSNDTEVIKKELSRSFITPAGKKVELTSRVDKIRDLVDQFEQNPSSVSLEGFTLQAPQKPSTAPSQQPVPTPTQQENVSQGAPESFSEGFTPEVEALINRLASPTSSNIQFAIPRSSRTAGEGVGADSLIDQLSKSSAAYRLRGTSNAN